MRYSRYLSPGLHQTSVGRHPSVGVARLWWVCACRGLLALAPSGPTFEPVGCRAEILAAAASLQARSGGRPFSPQDIIGQMNRAGTRYSEGTIRAEVVSLMCVNSPDNHGTTWPDLRRVGWGQYVLNSDTTASTSAQRAVTLPPASADPRGWPWEGHVQALFGAYLLRHGWLITSLADTATKARGVDLLAHKGPRLLGAEVKGWPSSGYADPDAQRRPNPHSPALKPLTGSLRRC